MGNRYENVRIRFAHLNLFMVDSKNKWTLSPPVGAVS